MSYSRLARHLSTQAQAMHELARLSMDPGSLDRDSEVDIWGWHDDPTAKTVETIKQPDPAWKKAVIEANGNQCSWVEAGSRCPKTTANTDLQAKSYGSTKPEDCIALCPAHAEAAEG
jgi:hypothetical protein